jgi:hypothetical protein
MGLLLVFLGTLLCFNIAIVPLAQAIWGIFLPGYKNTGSAITSVFMIAYGKGNMEVLLDIN